MTREEMIKLAADDSKKYAGTAKGFDVFTDEAKWADWMDELVTVKGVNSGRYISLLKVGEDITEKELTEIKVILREGWQVARREFIAYIKAMFEACDKAYNEDKPYCEAIPLCHGLFIQNIYSVTDGKSIKEYLAEEGHKDDEDFAYSAVNLTTDNGEATSVTKYEEIIEELDNLHD